GESCDILEGEAVTTPEQAAKLLSVCTPERLLAIPEDIRTILLNSFSESEKVLNPGKPFTGIEGIIEVGETVPAPVLPGLGDLPLDPGQLEEKHRIADLGDAQEHVLDVERAV
ncbi:MAG: hypothetical protein WA766_11455, partial [Candidatus Acidiferrales bacterium]